LTSNKIIRNKNEENNKMIDHLELKTLNMDAMLRFYGDVLRPLGYELKVDGPAKGFGDNTSLDFFFVEGEPSTNVHYAFNCSHRAMVNHIYELADAAGYRLDRAPALATHIHPNYYASYLRDPDGHLVEFVCHLAEV
jgi:catechol 2,3-dioxygenase-like lactoylglutathione lyase family enzyme